MGQRRAPGRVSARARTRPWSPGTRAARKVKVSPLATWTDEQVDAYVAEHGVLVNPLREIGYTSIGCAPCTRPVKAGRGRPRRALGGQRQDRVRAARGDPPPASHLDVRGRRVAGRRRWPGGRPARGRTGRRRCARSRSWRRTSARTSRATSDCVSCCATGRPRTSPVSGSCTPRPARRPSTPQSPQRREARALWCVRADSAAHSAAWTPAVLRRDDVVVSVTAGADPGACQAAARRGGDGPRHWLPCRSADTVAGAWARRARRRRTRRPRPHHDPRSRAARPGRRRRRRPARPAGAARRARRRRRGHRGRQGARRTHAHPGADRGRARRAGPRGAARRPAQGRRPLRARPGWGGGAGLRRGRNPGGGRARGDVGHRGPGAGRASR